MKLWKVFCSIIACFMLLLLVAGCGKEALHFDAVVLNVEEGRLFVYQRGSDSESRELNYVSIKEDTKIVDSKGKKYEGKIEPGADVTVYYTDEMIEDIYPATYREIEKIVVTGEKDESLYEEGIEIVESRQSELQSLLEQHRSAQ